MEIGGVDLLTPLVKTSSFFTSIRFLCIEQTMILRKNSVG